MYPPQLTGQHTIWSFIGMTATSHHSNFSAWKLPLHEGEWKRTYNSITSDIKQIYTSCGLSGKAAATIADNASNFVRASLVCQTKNGVLCRSTWSAFFSCWRWQQQQLDVYHNHTFSISYANGKLLTWIEGYQVHHKDNTRFLKSTAKRFGSVR